MQYDICLGSDSNVVLTCTTEDAAERLASAIREEREQLYQAEDLDVHVREVDRGGGEAAEEDQEEATANWVEEDGPTDEPEPTGSEEKEDEEVGA